VESRTIILPKYVFSPAVERTWTCSDRYVTDEQILACLLEIAAGRITSCSSSLIAASWQQTRPTLSGPQTKWRAAWGSKPLLVVLHPDRLLFNSHQCG